MEARFARGEVPLGTDRHSPRQSFPYGSYGPYGILFEAIQCYYIIYIIITVSGFAWNDM